MADLDNFMRNVDMSALRDYVRAKDGHEYEALSEDMVVVSVTHSNLRSRNIELRLDRNATVLDAKDKIYHFVGTKPQDQALVLKSQTGEIAELSNNDLPLGAYNVQHGMEIYVVDLDPYSLSKGGGLEDVSLVKKYEMTEEEYDKRANTVREYKRKQKLLKEMELQKKIAAGEVGVEFDEPVGKSSGVRNGKEIFPCGPGYGGFVRGKNVTVGDFPEFGMEDEDEL